MELVKILKDIKCNFISCVQEPIFTIVADNTWLNYAFTVSPKGTIIDDVTLRNQVNAASIEHAYGKCQLLYAIL